MNLQRSSGILMHISSLPGKYGYGTLGNEAYEFADFLKKSGQKYWQVLPFNPVKRAFAFSPYSSPSTFAGNKFFISFESLNEFSWFDKKITDDLQEKENNDFCDYESVDQIFKVKMELCHDLFKQNANDEEKNDYQLFKEIHFKWLEDNALFSAISRITGTDNWHDWDVGLSSRNKDVINEFKKDNADLIDMMKFTQYLFFHQWNKLKDYCNLNDIKLIGDIPIYVNNDSSDFWSNPGVFLFDKETGIPQEISGVPPDYFSKTGQRWGNPLYKWFDKNGSLSKECMNWWIHRIKHQIKMVDVLRIDHFRAFESYWAIPNEEETAINGKWKKGPGCEFFKQIEKSLGDLPLIAEDLGVITPEVEELRDNFNFPGMKILQFAFDINSKNTYIPHNLRNPNCVIYTGTHDNNTTNGWYYSGEVSSEQKDYIKRYLNLSEDHDMHKKMIRLAYSTTADLVIVPLQDVLGIGQEGRMNKPGTIENNWKWKLRKNQLNDDYAKWLYEETRFYNRLKNDRK